MMHLSAGYPDSAPETFVEGWPRELDVRYRAARFLQMSSTHAVILAVERATGRRVVVKTLRRVRSEEMRARFHREVRALRTLDHPGVVAVLEDGEVAGQPYLVMPYVAGCPLAARPTLEDPVGVMLEVADALEAIHAAGLVHRDLKPANIVIDDAGHPVIIDFGLAQADDARRLTAAGWVVGTPGFTAPEVFRTQRSSRRADWFAWGVTLFWLLEGRMPFTPAEILGAATGKGLEPPPMERTDGPVAGAVRRALAPDPIDRPCSKRSVERLLRRTPPLDATVRALPVPAGLRPPRGSWLSGIWRLVMAAT